MGFLSMRDGLLSFDELVAKVVDDVFRSIFGEHLAFSIWTYLEVNFIERLDVARKPKAFSDSLKDLFGSTTAQTLEGLILKRLCQVLKVKLELKGGLKFSDCISELRNAYMEILAIKYEPLIKG